MIRKYRPLTAFVSIFALAAVLIAGCGGGGGGGTPSPTTYVVTGTVLDMRSKNTTTPIVVSGAVVTIGGKTTTTDSQGNFRLEFTSAPTGSTWSVDGSNALPSPGYYNFWAQLGIVTDAFDARALPMPAITSASTTMPTVYLWPVSEPPPYR